MSEKILCVVCPLGCKLLVDIEGDSVSVEGNKCSKGVDFAHSEIVESKRNLATSIPIDGQVFSMLSVRLSRVIPLRLFSNVLSEIASLRPETPIHRGQVLIHNVSNTGVDVIATRTVY